MLCKSVNTDHSCFLVSFANKALVFHISRTIKVFKNIEYKIGIATPTIPKKIFFGNLFLIMKMITRYRNSHSTFTKNFAKIMKCNCKLKLQRFQN